MGLKLAEETARWKQLKCH